MLWQTASRHPETKPAPIKAFGLISSLPTLRKTARASVLSITVPTNLFPKVRATRNTFGRVPAERGKLGQEATPRSSVPPLAARTLLVATSILGIARAASSIRDPLVILEPAGKPRASFSMRRPVITIRAEPEAPQKDLRL